MIKRAIFVAAVALATMLVGASSALARPYAPLDRPGPKLSIPRSELRASLECTGDVRDSRRSPVLLLAGTGATPEENFGWNYQPALRQAGIPTCVSTPADDNLGDIQRRSELIVYGIRRVNQISGRRVALVGHSQGGMVGRWPLRFWPDTRRKVKDVIGMAPSNHGTQVAGPVCNGGCPPAFWQQMVDSDFLRALNSRRETFRGIDYTSVITRNDEVVVPATGGFLDGPRKRVTNVATQDVCPLNLADHLAVGTYDPVAWALVRDALTHRGPARPGRVPGAVCNETLMPGVDPATFLTDAADALVGLGANSARAERVPAEPKLRRYVFR